MMRHHSKHHGHDDRTADAPFGDEGGRGRRRRGGFGPGGMGPGGFGPGPDGFGPGFGGRHGGRGGRRGGRPRGDVRIAILALLAEQPRHGYDLMRAIEERTEGAWSPSAGSIYPTLQSLEDEGLVAVDTVDGRRTASLTDQGRSWLEEHAAEASSVFETDASAGGAASIKREMMALGEAAMHVARQSTGSEMTAQAAQVIAAARRDLYKLLADAEG